MFRRKTNAGFDLNLLFMISSTGQARRHARAGHLDEILLVPERFGGKKRTANIVYLPPYAAAAKRVLETEKIAPLLAGDATASYDVVPQYWGTSIIPHAIELRFTGLEGERVFTVHVWDPHPRHRARR